MDEATKATIATALTRIETKGASVFTGPMADQAAAVRVPQGAALQYGDPGIEGMDWFVTGVVGQLAK